MPPKNSLIRVSTVDSDQGKRHPHDERHISSVVIQTSPTKLKTVQDALSTIKPLEIALVDDESARIIIRDATDLVKSALPILRHRLRRECRNQGR